MEAFERTGIPDPEILKCKRCKLAFRSRDDFHRHLILSDMHCACKYCFEEFANPKTLKEHIRQYHPTEQDITCKCGTKFNRAGGLIAHLSAGECALQQRQISDVDIRRVQDQLLEYFKKREAEEEEDKNLKVEAVPGNKAPIVKVDLTTTNVLADYQDSDDLLFFEHPVHNGLSPDNPWSTDQNYPGPYLEKPKGKGKGKYRVVSSSADPDLLASDMANLAIPSLQPDVMPQASTSAAAFRTAKALPAQATPAKALPAKAGPSKAGPSKATPAKATPAKAAPAKWTPAKSTPGKTTPAKAVDAEAVEEEEGQWEEGRWDEEPEQAVAVADADADADEFSWTKDDIIAQIALQRLIAEKANMKNEFHPSCPNFDAQKYWNKILHVYKCPYIKCGKTKPNKNLFLQHLVSPAHQDEKITCTFCARVYASPTAYTQHFESQGKKCRAREMGGDVITRATGGIIKLLGENADDTQKYGAWVDDKNPVDPATAVLVASYRAKEEEAKRRAEMGKYYVAHPQW